MRLSFLCGAKPPEAEFLACYIGFSVALDSEAPRFLVVYENLSLALLLMCFLLAGRYCSVAVVNWMKTSVNCSDTTHSEGSSAVYHAAYNIQYTFIHSHLFISLDL